MNSTSRLYWIETGNYLQIAVGTSPMEAVKQAFLKKEPEEAGIITEARPFIRDPEEGTFYVDTVDAMRSVGFNVE